MTTVPSHTPTFTVQRASERAFFDHGWLQTYHSFSFAEYFDPKNLHWGALRVFNDDTIAGGAGFPTHPHRDMEIITYVFSGALEHRDSMGNHGVVSSGGVQFMSAGTGVRHSEYNASTTQSLHLVQMWVLPGKLNQPPLYGQKDFTIDDRRNRWLTVASGPNGLDAPIRLTQDATFRVARLEDEQLVHDFGPQRYGFLFVGDGALDVNGETLRAGDAARVFGISRLAIKGFGDIVLWDTCAIDEETGA